MRNVNLPYEKHHQHCLLSPNCEILQGWLILEHRHIEVNAYMSKFIHVYSFYFVYIYISKFAMFYLFIIAFFYYIWLIKLNVTACEWAKWIAYISGGEHMQDFYSTLRTFSSGPCMGLQWSLMKDISMFFQVIGGELYCWYVLL